MLRLSETSPSESESVDGASGLAAGCCFDFNQVRRRGHGEAYTKSTVPGVYLLGSPSLQERLLVRTDIIYDRHNGFKYAVHKDVPDLALLPYPGPMSNGVCGVGSSIG